MHILEHPEGNHDKGNGANGFDNDKYPHFQNASVKKNCLFVLFGNVLLILLLDIINCETWMSFYIE